VNLVYIKVQSEWRLIKRENKEKLARWVYKNCGVELNIDSLFDV
jgi:hypothetical protein